MALSETTNNQCKKCLGTGHIMEDNGGLEMSYDCAECDGTGLIDRSELCQKCKGTIVAVVDMGDFSMNASCDHCQGSGLEPKKQ